MPQVVVIGRWSAFEANMVLQAMSQIRALIECEVADWELAGVGGADRERLRSDLRRRYATAWWGRKIAREGGLRELKIEVHALACELVLTGGNDVPIEK